MIMDIVEEKYYLIYSTKMKQDDQRIVSIFVRF
jgi:hypothetical protein